MSRTSLAFTSFIRTSRSAPCSTCHPINPSARPRLVQFTYQPFNLVRCVASSSRLSSTGTAAAPKPRRPSPYRLLQAHAFLAEFAPLHVKGWRVDNLSKQEQRVEKKDDGDLQDRRLVRAFDMGQGKDGWRDLMRFVQKVGEVVEEQDHHPTIHISPILDYKPPLRSLLPTDQSRGYIVELSTHTHTPLPPYPSPTKGEKNERIQMRPGITGKDLNLAMTVESVWEEVMKGKQLVDVKVE